MTFEIVFYGVLIPGMDLTEVQGRLAQLFKTDIARIDKMFSGQRVVLKKQLDQESALKYQAILKKAGIQVTVEPPIPQVPVVEPVPVEPMPAKPAPGGPSSMTLAPVGATLGKETEFVPLDLDLSHLSLAEAGADLEQLKDARPPVQVDISHLKLQ